MRSERVLAYDRALVEAFSALQMPRVALGIYARTDDGIIWRGIWVTFFTKRDRVVVQPNVVVFCPRVDKLVSQGLSEVYGTREPRTHFGKLGGPSLTDPLYHLVRKNSAEERHSFSYDIGSIDDIASSVELIKRDFASVGMKYVDSVTSMESLKDRLMTHWTAWARMHALVATYLMNGEVTEAEFDQIVTPRSNEMTHKFGAHFRNKFLRPAGKKPKKS